MKKVLKGSIAIGVTLFVFLMYSGLTAQNKGCFAGCSKKGNWTLTQDGTAHHCVKGSPKNCIITGGSVPIGGNQQ